MEWKKSSPEMAEKFAAALPSHPDIERRRMFGYAACFVKGNFFVGMHEDNMVVRLPGDLKGKFSELATASIFDPMHTGKGMKDWWLIPTDIAQDHKRLANFLDAAFAEVVQLPAKVKKPKAAKSKLAKKVKAS
jgi:TfoX/Sxy family transcriptional regulator of competence genes